MKYITALFLLTIAFNANAFVRTNLLEQEVYITKDFFYFTDKFETIYKAKTTCDIVPNKQIKVSIIGKALTNSSKIRIAQDKKTERCKVLELSYGRTGWD